MCILYKKTEIEEKRVVKATILVKSNSIIVPFGKARGWWVHPLKFTPFPKVPPDRHRAHAKSNNPMDVPMPLIRTQFIHKYPIIFKTASCFT